RAEAAVSPMRSPARPLDTFCINPRARASSHSLSLHDALPISIPRRWWSAETYTRSMCPSDSNSANPTGRPASSATGTNRGVGVRSEEHTSELQSRGHLVCRLLLENKNDDQHRVTGQQAQVSEP